MFFLRSLLGRLVLLSVLAVAAAGAGWYFFIREDNKAQEVAADVTDDVRRAAAASPSPAASAAPGGSPAPSATAASTGAGGGLSSLRGASYRVVEGQGSAWYLAPEKLASLPTTSVAKGTTKEVRGEFHFTAEGLDPARKTTFTVGLASIASDQSRRDSRMHQALETQKFPTATFTATRLVGLPAEFTAQEVEMQLTGILDLHGVQKEVTWKVQVKKDAATNILSGLATTEFKYSDFGSTKPDIAGFVTVEENVQLQVQLFVAPA